MDKIRIVPETGFHGEGISEGLARGLLVYYNDCNLTGEGMGIGSIAIRDRQYTYFSRSSTDTYVDGVLKRTFTLDTCMKWSVLGRRSGIFTRWTESYISFYMKFPRIQSVLMRPVHNIRSLFHIHPSFETVSPRGNVTFTYLVNGDQVDVKVNGDMPVRRHDTICLLNELSASWFSAGWREGPTGPPSAWEEIRSGSPDSLYDSVHGIRFFLDDPTVNVPVPLTLYQGSEYTRDLCWAGFCIQMGPMNDEKVFPEIRYRIGFKDVVPP